MDLYIDGERIETPKLTKLEKKLALRLSEASFGSLENDDFASVRSDRWCGEGGFERVELIEWPDRHQLGALLKSLQAKRLIVLSEGELDWRPSMEVWFDCEALRGLACA